MAEGGGPDGRAGPGPAGVSNSKRGTLSHQQQDIREGMGPASGPCNAALQELTKSPENMYLSPSGGLKPRPLQLPTRPHLLKVTLSPTAATLGTKPPTGPNLKEWLREQFCDHPLEHCEDTRLHDAAYVGDLQTLRNLLQEESYQSRINEKSVWCCGWLPCTPLRIAATAGHGNCVDFLIRKGAEVDLVDVKGQTALYMAVVNGHLESAQILLEAGADPNGSRHHRSTPVYHASRVGRADILQALIRYGADVDVNHHLTPNIRPAFSRRLTSLVVCPLYISAAYHNLQCFQLLLQAGANPDFNCNGPVNTQEFYRGSPGCVMDAVLRHGCEAAFVSLLVEFGANLNLVLPGPC
ncbi:ankyrin repeat and SOCS box protein 1 isoform X3 [Heterocephalus glaber]|uniref:Ankyrin repeat and SOCS box protein 1 isoform X3 n=1 Tax=Heterocephalus glaber TaxID=10181 RepID=A0AAX6QA18_HETGA|nr:ankyrin repeat and SOCS box protein 1 isoform X3 [Heterocephalus glaber]